MRPEAVVVATGATPLIPSIPGIEHAKVITAADLHLSRKKAGDKIIVVGAALTGCDTALSLAQQGEKVTIVKMRPGAEVALDLNPMSRMRLLEELAKNGVTFLFDHTINEFNADGLVATDKEGKQKNLNADTMVLALGAKSKNRLAEDLGAKVNEFYVVGDCLSPRKVGEAMREGFVAGWRI